MILHLMGDFYLQTEKVAKCKNAKIDIDCQDCIKCKKKSLVLLQIMCKVQNTV